MKTGKIHYLAMVSLLIAMSSCGTSNESLKSPALTSNKLIANQELTKLKSRIHTITHSISFSKAVKEKGKGLFGETGAALTAKSAKLQIRPHSTQGSGLFSYRTKVTHSRHGKEGLSGRGLIYKPGSCDTIVFNGGSELYEKVMGLNRKYVTYQDCDAPNGPLHTFLRANVKEIKYANGFVERVGRNSPTTKIDVKDSPDSHTGDNNSSENTDNLGELWVLMLAMSFALYAIGISIGIQVLGMFFLFLGGMAGIASLVYFVCWLLKIKGIIN